VKSPKGFTIALVVLVTGTLLLPMGSLGFSFRESEEREAEERRRAKEEHAARIERLLSVPCDEKLKKRKIALLIGEQVETQGVVYEPGKYGPLFQEISRRLKGLGLRTYTREEIQAQIAAAEVKAFLNNDVDAAATAARRLGASYFLRGMIRSKVRMNPVVRTEEVFVTMALTLVDASGRTLSHVTAGGDAYSGPDPMETALRIARNEADLAVAALYHDFCLNAPGR
jgi:hypothetical protein